VAPGASRRRVEGEREQEILLATLDVLAEVGYDRMTFDLVAARTRASKATLYRRWPSKEKLVAEAVASLPVTDVALPDTGSLRGDLLALATTEGFFDAPRARLACGLATALYRDPQLHELVRRTLAEAGVAHLRALLRRAVDRGVLRADLDVTLIAEVLPGIALFRLLLSPANGLTRADVTAVLERIVLPALDLDSEDPS
jgi:AcrR family transcriptional regulator